MRASGPPRRRSSARRRGPAVILWVIAWLAIALLVLPLLGILLSAPWPQLPGLLLAPETLQALGLSLGTGAISTLLCLILGVPLAVIMARSVAWSVLPRRLLRAAVTIPLVLPPVVGGLALLLLLGRSGILGRYLAQLGITLPFTTGAVVIAQTFVAMPFLVFAVEGALRGADRRVELAAASLGASPFRVFRTVTIPLVAPGIAAGAVLCFARALGEFGATITFAGSYPGITRTLPIASYLASQTNLNQSIALALVLLAVSVVVLLSLRDRWLPGVRG
ncbi:MAG: molybdate ABC transporter permease subunit [Acidobacteria bacterium]|nr:molybdate ABC transporter permease subunit [Acidobacteriota bacterium]